MTMTVRRLRQIPGGRTSASEAPLERALQAVIDASSAAAGAVCLYDRAEGVLRLAVEIGLSDEGCRVLRKLPSDVGIAWAPPLDAVRTGRIHLFDTGDDASLPALLGPGVPPGAIACIPLVHDGVARGCLVLVTAAPAHWDAGRVQSLGEPIADVVRAIDAVRTASAEAPREPIVELDAAVTSPWTLRRLRALDELVGDGAETGRRADLDRGDAPGGIDDRDAVDRARDAELEHLAARLTEAERAWAREHGLRLEQELRHERARKRADLDRDEAIRRARALAEAAEKQRAAIVLETETLRASIAEIECRRLEAEHAARRVETERDDARAAELAARSDVASAIEAARSLRADLAARDEALERERVRVAVQAREHEDLRATAERVRFFEARVERLAAERDEALRRAADAEGRTAGERLAAEAELDALRSALAEAQRQMLDAEARGESELDERLESTLELYRRGEEARAALLGELDAARHAMEVREEELARVRAEATAADTAATARAAERDAARAEVTRLAAALASATDAAARAAELEAELARRDHELSALRIREATAREECETASAEQEALLARATTLVRSAEEARAAAAGEAEAVRTALANAQTLIIQAEDDAARARTEAERHREEAAALRTELGQLRALPGDPRGAAAREQPVAGRADVGVARMLDPAARGVIVVSTDERFATGADAVRVAPGDGVAAGVASARRARVVVDLGSSGGLEAIAAIRAAGVAVPITGCVAVADRAAVVPLGPVETTPRSLDPDAVLALLAAHSGRTRVLAVGGDPDRLLSVRQALTRAELSMSIAWDAKQADDLFRLVRPEVVIVDLGLPVRAGHRIALRLRTLDPRPLAVLVPAADEDAAVAFAAVASEPGQPTPALPHARVVDAAD
jgi:hypothetical protein